MFSLANPLFEGIPYAISSTMVTTYAGDPYLTLLLKVVLIYALFTESENEREGTHLGAIMKAQELIESIVWALTSSESCSRYPTQSSEYYTGTYRGSKSLPSGRALGPSFLPGETHWPFIPACRRVTGGVMANALHRCHSLS